MTEITMECWDWDPALPGQVNDDFLGRYILRRGKNVTHGGGATFGLQCALLLLAFGAKHKTIAQFSDLEQMHVG